MAHGTPRECMHTATYTFPTSNCSYPSAYGHKFPGTKKKRRQAEQEGDSHKTQGPALRLGSKIHGLVRSAKNRKAVSNESQTAGGRGEFWSSSFLTQSQPK